MAYAQESVRVKRLIDMYRGNPNMFNEEQLDELQVLAKQTNLTFNRISSDFNLRNITESALGGVVEGFTTIPIGRQPRNTYEAIAHSMGHLVGFAPGIAAIPLRGLASGASKLGMMGVKKAFEKGAFGAQTLNKFSVPMFFGDKASDLLNRGITKAGLESIEYMKRGSAVRGVINDAAHLGVASAVSSIWGGPDQILNSMAHGTIAGGAFGGLGNFKRIGNLLKSKNVANHKQGEQLIKAGIGSMMLGLPTTLQDQPIEMQMYQYLLGGFFGYNARPSHEKAAQEFFHEDLVSGRPDRIFYPEKNSEWSKLSKETQDYVYKQSADQARISMLKTGAWKSEQELDTYLNNEAKKRKGDSYTPEDVNNIAREQAGKIIQGGILVDLEAWENPMPEDLGDPRQEARHQMLVQIFRKPDGTISSVESMPRGGDYRGLRMDTKAPIGETARGEPAWDIPAEKFDGREIVTLQYINPKAEAGSKGRIVAFKPFQAKLNSKTGELEYRVTQKDWFAIEDHLNSQNMYIDGGVKDKGVLKISQYHPDINRIKINNMIDNLARGMLQERLETDPNISKGDQKRFFNAYKNEVRQNYEDSVAKEYEWFQDAVESEGMRQHVKDIHDKAWKSNILYESERHGLFIRGGDDFTQIGKLMNSKVGAKNVVDRNKREQIFHTKNIPMNFDINGKKDLNITVLDDFIASKDEHPDMWYKTEITHPAGTIERGVLKETFERPYESATDGTIYIRRSVWDELAKKSGFMSGDEFVNDLLEKTGMLKPTIATKFDTGVLIGKAAGRKASESMDKFMEANDLDMVLMSSAAKHKGGIKSVKYDYKDGTYFTMDPMDIRKMPISDLRLDLGVYENPIKSNSPQMLVRQLFGNLNEGQHPGVVEHVFKSVYEPIINGRPEQNNLIESYINKPSMDLDFKDLDIDSISLKNIHKILVSDGKDLKELRQYVRDHIVKVDKDKPEGESDLNFTDDQWRDYTFRNKRIFNTVGTTDAVADGFKATNKFWEHSYKRYIIDRYLRPKWQFSGKGWAAPYDVEILRDRKVEPGTFLLDNGKNNMPVDFNADIIKIFFPKKKGNKVTLGEVVAAQRRIEKPDNINKLKSLGVYNKAKKALDNFDYEFVIIRVPADSSSGARVLRFKGFTGQEGNAIVTHPKDDAYLGGMDKDSDSMFIYHGFDNKIKDAYKSVKNEWEKDGVLIEGKSSELNNIFNEEANEAPYLHPASIYSPSMRKEVARNVYQGNLGIGWAINSRMTVLSWMDMAAADGGKLTVDAYKKKGYGLDYGGTNLGQYVLTLKPDSSYNVRRYAREMLNRSADAGNYPKMKSYTRFPDLLLKQAFDIEYIPPNWMKDPKYNEMRNSYEAADFNKITSSTDLGKVHKMNQTMKPNSKSKIDKSGKSMELYEFQERLAAESITSDAFKHEPKNLISLIARKAKADGLDKMTFTHPYESNVTLLNKLRDVITKDPLAKELDLIIGLSTEKNIAQARAKAQDGGKKQDWKQFAEILRKENIKVASFLSLVRKAHAIEKRILAEGGSKKDVTRNLKVLVKEADKLKLKYRTIDNDPDTEHKNSSFNDYDSDVIELKNRIRETLGKQGMKSEPFEEYLDLYLLSPFLKSSTFGYHSRMPWQSRAIGNKAVKEVFNELDVITTMARLPEVKQVDKLAAFQDYLHQPSGYAKINSSFSKFMGEEFVGDAEFDVRIKRLKDHMADHPFWAEHPEDAFIQYTTEFEGGVGRNFSTMTKNDVNNLLRFFEYYDPKSKESWIDKFVKGNFPDTKDRDPMRIQHIFYYNRPATLDKKTLAYEVNIFKQANVPIKTKDGVVIKNVKRIMSTHGSMREWLSKMVVQSEAKVSDHLNRMDEGSFSNLQNLTPNERVELMNHVVDVIEQKIKIEDIPDYLNKKFEISVGKDKTAIFTGRKMIESYVDKVKNELEQFGNEYIYAAKDWKTIEKDIKSASLVKLSEYMKWHNGKFDFKNFYKKVIEPAWHGKDIGEIPLEAIYRAQYEYKLEQIIREKKIDNPSQYRTLWRNNGLRDPETREILETAFKPIGRRDKETYFPHIWRINKTKAEQRLEDKYYNDLMQEELSRSMSNPDNIVKYLRSKAKLMNKESSEKLTNILNTYEKTKDPTVLQEVIETVITAKYQYIKEGLSHPTEYGESHIHEALTQVDMKSDVAHIVSDLVKVGFFSRPKNMLERQIVEKPAYMREYDAIKRYKEGVLKSRYKNLAALMGDAQIDIMTKNKPFGKHTKDHAEFYRMYLRDSLGYKTTFSDWVLKAMESSDPLKLKKNLYYQTSDHEIIKKFDRILKFFKTDKLPFDLSSNNEARSEQLSRIIHKLGSMEAKYQLLTLLANTGVATGNLFGGSVNTITKTGLRNFTRAMNFKYLESNLLKNANGEYQLKFKNGKDVKTKNDLKKWAIEKGVVEQYIKNELEFNPKISTLKNRKALNEFAKDFQKLLLRNPEPNRETIMEIARRHGVGDLILEIGAFPMQASERWLRINSFLSHMLHIRDSFGGLAGDVNMNSDAIVKHALKGVEATQFVYHSVGRSAFMRTATGKVLTRFKNYVQNQIAFQREIYKQAKMYGFEPGTKPYDDFQRLFMINAMLMALGTAYSYSLFDVATPPPFDWMRETAELLWGNSKERERAFFGTYPRAVAPLQILTPPIARVPQSLVMLLNGDWERFADYQAWTLFPFGRFARSVDKTFNEPYGTTFGRGMQQFFRLPTDKFVRRYKKSEVEDMRKDYIATTLDDLDQEGEEWDNKEN
tara:strand:- start:755 stop:9013 length:8259 start_codon:yes stop_codon:yes gene_type:complete